MSGTGSPVSATTVARAAMLVVLSVWALAGTWAIVDPWRGVLLAAGGLAALAVGHRLPLLALVASFGALFTAGTLGLTEDPYLAMLIWACYLVGRHAGLPRQPWAAAGVLLLLSSNLAEPGRDTAPGDVVFPVLLTAAPWLLGLSVQLARRQERLALEQAREVLGRRSMEIRHATAEERLHIARELHDAVAHGISAVSLQAQVARRAVEAGRVLEVDDLRSIERTAQQVMADIRRLLGVVRVDGTEASVLPVVGMDDLDSLLEECRRSGQRLRIATSGTRRSLSPALSAAAYRILQEALTNARRHGGDGTTDVRVHWSGHELAMEVRNALPAGAGAGEDAGHGITGMQERARLFGGGASVACEGADWVVRVRLPLPAPAPEVVS